MASSDEDILGRLPDVKGKFAKAVLSGDDEEDEEADEVQLQHCVLSGEAINPRTKSSHCLFGLKPLSKKSYNALHALDRMCKKSAKLTSDVRKCQGKDFERFREIALSLVNDKVRGRTVAQRAASMEYVEQMCKDLIHARKDKWLLLPKKPFISWFMWHERMSEKKAKEMWAECKADSNITRENVNGRLCLAVRQFRELSKTDQVRNSKGMDIDKRESTSPQASRKKVLSSKSGLGSTGDDFLGGVGRVGASCNLSSMFDDSSDDGPAPAHAMKRQKTGESPASSKPREMATPKKSKSKSCIDDDDDEDSDDKATTSVGQAAGSDGEDGDDEEEGGEDGDDAQVDVGEELPEYKKSLRPADFFDWKKSLQKKATNSFKSVADVYKDTSKINKWDKLYAAVKTDDRVPSLEFEKVKKNLAEAIDHASEKIANVAKWFQKSADIKTSREALVQSIKDVETSVESFSDVVETLKRVKAEHGKQAGSEKRKDQRKVKKISDSLVASKVGKCAAAFLAKHVHDLLQARLDVSDIKNPMGCLRVGDCSKQMIAV